MAESIDEHAITSGAALRLAASDLAIVLMARVNGLAIERMAAPKEVPTDLLVRVLALLVASD